MDSFTALSTLHGCLFFHFVEGRLEVQYTTNSGSVRSEPKPSGSGSQASSP